MSKIVRLSGTDDVIAELEDIGAVGAGRRIARRQGRRAERRSNRTNAKATRRADKRRTSFSQKMERRTARATLRNDVRNATAERKEVTRQNNDVRRSNRNIRRQETIRTLGGQVRNSLATMRQQPLQQEPFMEDPLQEGYDMFEPQAPLVMQTQPFNQAPIVVQVETNTVPVEEEMPVDDGWSDEAWQQESMESTVEGIWGDLYGIGRARSRPTTQRQTPQRQLNRPTTMPRQQPLPQRPVANQNQMRTRVPQRLAQMRQQRTTNPPPASGGGLQLNGTTMAIGGVILLIILTSKKGK